MIPEGRFGSSTEKKYVSAGSTETMASQSFTMLREGGMDGSVRALPQVQRPTIGRSHSSALYRRIVYTVSAHKGWVFVFRGSELLCYDETAEFLFGRPHSGNFLEQVFFLLGVFQCWTNGGPTISRGIGSGRSRE